MSAGIAERLVVATLAERPELRGQAFSAEFAAAVPEFMRHDPTALLYYGAGHLDHYLDFVLVAEVPAEAFHRRDKTKIFQF